MTVRTTGHILLVAVATILVMSNGVFAQETDNEQPMVYPMDHTGDVHCEEWGPLIYEETYCDEPYILCVPQIWLKSLTEYDLYCTYRTCWDTKTGDEWLEEHCESFVEDNCGC